MEPQQLYSQDDIAEHLGCSVRTLERYRVSGDGPRFVKIGRLVRYRAIDLDAWLAERVRGSTSEADAP
jgi:predicted DNA-binding transcriptional regulator AlpA